MRVGPTPDDCFRMLVYFYPLMVTYARCGGFPLQTSLFTTPKIAFGLVARFNQFERNG